MSNSPGSMANSVRLASTNRSRSTASSLRITPRSRASSARMASSSAMVARSSSNSAASSLRPRRVRRPSGVSRMWLAWTSENAKGFAMRPLRASGRSADERIRAITSSSMSTARSRPSTTCARSVARARRYSERRRTTVIWCAT